MEEKINTQYNMVEFEIEYKVDLLKRGLDGICRKFKKEIAESKDRIKK